MKTTLDIPDDLATEVQRRAERSGREPGEQYLFLVRLALTVEDVPVAQWEPFLRLFRQLRDVQLAEAPHHRQRAPMIAIDPGTGLPVIHSPPDAPVHSMTAEQLQTLADETQLEEDLERAGLSLRH